MNLIIRRYFVTFAALSLGLMAGSQTFAEDEQEPTRTTNSSYDTRSRLISLSGDVTRAIPSGSQYIGKAMDGETGYNFNAQLFVYKQLFLNATFGQNYFTVSDRTLVGNYEKSTVNYNYLSIGYEFLPFQNLRLGLSFSVSSNLSYKNIYNSREVFQIDTGNLNAYNLYIDYEIVPYMAFYATYSYRNDKMAIKTPTELSSFFDRAQFHSIGVGLKFYIGKTNLFK